MMLLKKQGWCAAVAALSSLASGSESLAERPDPALLMFIADFSIAGRHVDPMAVDQAMTEIAGRSADSPADQTLPSSLLLPAETEAGADETGSAAVEPLPETDDEFIHAPDEEQDDAHN